jgi:predicted metal-dependent enzyme (double-stranded beta helix superfamily)
MSYTLEQLAADCRAAMDRDSGPAGREEVRKFIEKACADSKFVSKYLGPDNITQRQVIYEDDKHKFCILAHVYEGAKGSNPHDHGPSWAIYGQADGVTTMTEWKKIEEPHDGAPGKVKKVRDYDMTPGIAYLYNEGDLHSPSRTATTRLIRVEGQDLTNVKRDKYEAVA